MFWSGTSPSTFFKSTIFEKTSLRFFLSTWNEELLSFLVNLRKKCVENSEKRFFEKRAQNPDDWGGPDRNFWWATTFLSKFCEETFPRSVPSYRWFEGLFQKQYVEIWKKHVLFSFKTIPSKRFLAYCRNLRNKNRKNIFSKLVHKMSMGMSPTKNFLCQGLFIESLPKTFSMSETPKIEGFRPFYKYLSSKFQPSGKKGVFWDLFFSEKSRKWGVILGMRHKNVFANL